jgi:hypothetical protein
MILHVSGGRPTSAHLAGQTVRHLFEMAARGDWYNFPENELAWLHELGQLEPQ